MNTKKNKHLTLNARRQIELALNERLSFKAIAASIHKDCTTVSKEIKGHILFEKKGAPYRPFNDCIHRKSCHITSVCSSCNRKAKSRCSTCGKCTSHCADYEKENCLFLQKPPYVCNGCPKRNECTLEKHMYRAREAQKEYEEVRSESRSGINLTEEERAQLDSVISPLIQKGQSLHHILTHNADVISCCEKTAYLYMDYGLFKARNIDMPRKVRFRPRKAKSVVLKVDKACRAGRTYQEFLEFRREHPFLPVVELDTVEGMKGRPVLLTIHFVLPRLQLAFWRSSNNSQSVTDIFDHLYEVLGKDIYCRLFPVLLCDNGTEFSNPKALEFDKAGNRRSYVFYCDPSAPHEKGACEVNHEFIRRVIPKGTDIGKYSDDQIRLMMDNINSYSRPELGNKSPYEMFGFYYKKKTLDLLNIRQIPANEIVLKPFLMDALPYRKEDNM